MTNITLIGAGGKMGCRLTDNFKKCAQYTLQYMEVVKEGFDKIVEMGVPEAAAKDFVLGNLRIQIAVLFQEVNGTFSDAAYKISKRAKPILFKENWKDIFEMDDIREQVKDITNK